MKKFILFSCLMLCTCTLNRAQSIDRELISTAGAFFETGTIQMAWVIGDLVSGTYDIGHLIVPFDPGTNLLDHMAGPSTITVYPNPSDDKVYLYMDNIKNCTYYLYDLQGREIQNGNMTSRPTELGIAPYESGVYILRIIKENTLVQESKIIKR